MTDHFAILKPSNPSSREFNLVKKKPIDVFEAVVLRNVRSGHPLIFNCQLLLLLPRLYLLFGSNLPSEQPLFADPACLLLVLVTERTIFLEI